MPSIVVGLGETGLPLFEILSESSETTGYDPKVNNLPEYSGGFLHICIPYSDKFIDIVRDYQDLFRPELTVIHSTVPIGTTDQLRDSVHSPIRGKHDRMKSDLLRYTKWVGGLKASLVYDLFTNAGFNVRMVTSSRQTEAMKLLCLGKYGVSLAFAQYCKKVADSEGFEYSDIYEWDEEYNAHVQSELKRPLLYVVSPKIGGHCVVQNTHILNRQYPNQMLDEILKYE